MPSDVQLASLTTLPTPPANFVIPGQAPSGPTRGVRVDTLQGMAVDAVEAGPVVLTDKSAATNVALRGLTTYFVDYVNGNDAWDGLSRGTPKKNLSTVIGSMRRIVLAPGFHTLSGTIGITSLQGLIIEGAAGFGSQLVVSGNYDAISISGLCDRIELRDLLIVSFVARASGAGIRMAASGSPHSMMVLDRIKIQNTHDGLVIDNVHRSHFARIDVEMTAAGMMPGHGIVVSRCVSSRFTDIVSGAIPSAGGQIGGYAVLFDYDCDTVAINGLECGRSVLDCLSFQNSFGVGHTGPRLVRGKGIWTEASSSGHGISIYSARDIHLDGVCSDLNNLDGIYVAGGASVRITSPWCALNQRNGINVAGGSTQEALVQCTIIDPDCTNNSQVTDATYDGITLTASGTPITLTGGRSGDHVYTVTNGQRYGVNVGASANYVSVIGPDLTGNKTGPVQVLSTGLNNYMCLRELDSWQVPRTWDASLYAGHTGAGTANDGYYFRVRGAAKISKIAFMVGVSSGNISVAVYRGLPGRNAPTTRLATSGSVACPAAGSAEVSLGSSVWVQDGDWFALSCDNTTATFGRVSAPAVDTNVFGEGTSYRGASHHPLPSPPTSLVGSTRMPLILVGRP